MLHVLLILRSRVNAGLETDLKAGWRKVGFVLSLVRLPSVIILFFSQSFNLFCFYKKIFTTVR